VCVNGWGLTLCECIKIKIFINFIQSDKTMLGVKFRKIKTYPKKEKKARTSGN
jgi:hypothetical protein